MKLDWIGLWGLLGPVSICLMLLVLGLLSRRLGRVTRSAPYYLGCFIGAGLVGISALARMVNLGLGPQAAAALHQDSGLVWIYTVLPAVGVTLGAFAAWHYWSWLLAERE
jgi:hypothetical protein